MCSIDREDKTKLQVLKKAAKQEFDYTGFWNRILGRGEDKKLENNFFSRRRKP